MSKIKNFMMDMEELVDVAVIEGASDFKEVANFVLDNYKPMSHVDIEYCKEYYKELNGVFALTAEEWTAPLTIRKVNF
tara:strand:- start:739 stop:972 length:234 start_codon:yes stop_codon:yes gene_type:complete